MISLKDLKRSFRHHMFLKLLLKLCLLTESRRVSWVTSIHSLLSMKNLASLCKRFTPRLPQSACRAASSGRKSSVRNARCWPHFRLKWQHLLLVHYSLYNYWARMSGDRTVRGSDTRFNILFKLSEADWSSVARWKRSGTHVWKGLLQHQLPYVSHRNFPTCMWNRLKLK